MNSYEATALANKAIALHPALLHIALTDEAATRNPLRREHTTPAGKAGSVSSLACVTLLYLMCLTGRQS